MCNKETAIKEVGSSGKASCILEIIGSNLGSDTEYPDSGSSLFYSVPRKSCDSPLNFVIIAYFHNFSNSFLTIKKSFDAM
jgi:hypothetical protein